MSRLCLWKVRPLLGQELLFNNNNNGRTRTTCLLGTISLQQNSSTSSSSFCFKPNAINQAKKRQPIKHKNARFSSFSQKPPTEASEEELLLTKTAELGKILSNLDNTQKHNILVVHKEQMKEASELAPELLTKIAEMRGQLLLDLNYAQKCLRNKDHPWCSMLVSSSTDFTMKLSMGKDCKLSLRTPNIVIRFLDNNGMSKIFYDYKIVSYKRDELFLQVGKSGKRVHPGQTVQLRNSSDREKTLNAKQRMLEMPASRWLSQPGYDCLLAFLNGHTADRGRGVGVEPSRILETKVHRNDLSEKNKFDGILFNPEQRDAIAAALDETKKFIAINGPSGSGKMRIAMEIIKKLYDDEKRLIIRATNPRLMPDLQRMGVDQNHVICTNMGYEHPRSHLALKKQHPKWNMIEKEYDHMRRLREKMHHHDLQYDELLKELSEYETGVERLHNQINSDLMKNVKILLDYCKSSMIERFLESGYAPDAQFIMTNIDLGTEFELLQAISQAPRIIVLGDTVEKIASYQLVQPSPLQRLADTFGEHSSTIFSPVHLKTQYQSNRVLVEWPNQVFRGQIQTDSIVADICLTDFVPNKVHSSEVVPAGSETNKAEFMNQLFQKQLVLIDTDLACPRSAPFFIIRECTVDGRPLFLNVGILAVVASYIRALVRVVGLRPNQIGIIGNHEPSIGAIKKLLVSGEQDIDVEELAFGDEHIFLLRYWATTATAHEVIITDFEDGLAQDKQPSLSMMIHRLSANMCHARRQFVLVARSSALANMDSPELNLLLALIREKGVVVSPDKFTIDKDSV